MNRNPNDFIDHLLDGGNPLYEDEPGIPPVSRRERISIARRQARRRSKIIRLAAAAGVLLTMAATVTVIFAVAGVL